ncbi:MAG: ATPase domain-containing protein [Candidatus Bathyarchaeia archaeon]
MDVLKRIIDTDVKAALLMLFHKDPNQSGTLEELAEKLGQDPADLKRAVEDFVKIGLIEEVKHYRFNQEKDREIQKLVAAKLAGEPKYNGRILEAKLSVGIDFVDELLLGGIPSPSTILLMGDPGSGRELFIYQVVAGFLKEGRRVTYISTDDFPSRIRESILRLGVDAKHYEVEGRLILVDCYSKLVGSKSEEKHVIDPSNLVEQTILLSKLLPGEDDILVLDSATTLLQSAGVKSSIEFLRRIIARARNSGVNFLLSLASGVFHPAIVAAIQEIVDGVVETKVFEEYGTLKNRLRILKMRNTEYKTVWVTYSFSHERGLYKAE